MNETPADQPDQAQAARPNEPGKAAPSALGWARYTISGGATGIGLSDAHGNIIAGFHKLSVGGQSRARRGGASNMPCQIYQAQRPSFLPVWTSQPTPMSPAEGRAVAARIKAGEMVEKVPEGLPDLVHITIEETRDLPKALTVCTVLICYVTQAELKRHGLMLGRFGTQPRWLLIGGLAVPADLVEPAGGPADDRFLTMSIPVGTQLLRRWSGPVSLSSWCWSMSPFFAPFWHTAGITSLEDRYGSRLARRADT